MNKRYQVEQLNPRVEPPFGVMNDGFADDYEAAIEKARDYADYHKGDLPVIFRIKDNETGLITEFWLVMSKVIHRFRIGV